MRCLFFLLVLLTIVPARADRLILIDGQEVLGRITSESATNVVVETDHGTMPFPRARIRKIEKTNQTENLTRKFETLLSADVTKAQQFCDQCEIHYPTHTVVFSGWEKKIKQKLSASTTTYLLQLEKQLLVKAESVASELDQLLIKLGSGDTTNSAFGKALAARAHLAAAEQRLDKSDAKIAGEHARRAFGYVPSDQAIALMVKCLGRYSPTVDEAYKLRLANHPDADLAVRYAMFLMEQKKVAEAYKILISMVPLKSDSPPDVKAVYSSTLQSLSGNYKLMAEAGLSEAAILAAMQHISPGYMEERHLILQFNKNQGDAQLTQPLLDYMIKKERYSKALDFLQRHLKITVDSPLNRYQAHLQPGIDLEMRTLAVETRVNRLLVVAGGLLRGYLEKIPHRVYTGTYVSESANVYTGDYEKDSYDNYEIIWVTKDATKAEQLGSTLTALPVRSRCPTMKQYAQQCEQFELTLSTMLRSLGASLDSPGIGGINMASAVPVVTPAAEFPEQLPGLPVLQADPLETASGAVPAIAPQRLPGLALSADLTDLTPVSSGKDEVTSRAEKADALTTKFDAGAAPVTSAQPAPLAPPSTPAAQYNPFLPAGRL